MPKTTTSKTQPSRTAGKPKRKNPPKKPVSKLSRKQEEVVTFPQDRAELSDTMPSKRRINMRYLLLLVLILALAGLFLLNRGLLVAATVNGSPIYRWELNTVLVDRFGAQTLEGIISERLIEQEARKQNITVTQDEIDARTDDILKNFGGDVNLDELLKFQGLTKDDFNKQIRMQLIVEKILGKDVVITDADIQNFIATNSAVLVATEEGQMQEEARQAILEIEIGKKVQEWFTSLKENANILKYIE